MTHTQLIRLIQGMPEDIGRVLHLRMVESLNCSEIAAAVHKHVDEVFTLMERGFYQMLCFEESANEAKV